MDPKQQAALKRLTKKLSALRQTLRKDERDILDTMVIGKPAEVRGHRLERVERLETMTGAARKKNTPKRRGGEPEVSGHALNPGSQTLGAQTLGAQTLGAQTLGAQTLGALTFDADQQQYTVVDTMTL